MSYKPRPGEILLVSKTFIWNSRAENVENQNSLVCARMSTQTDECLVITSAEQREPCCPVTSLLQSCLASVVDAFTSGTRTQY